ncbi:FK506-binding protein 1 [Tribonema minus]|uniref:peptidylprolyl isomerase n=1 Tax=Tribonema minus TaxID=303371 RepID=A0A835Z9V0_9STRA|nr:FK506-binding protein 1 [Tribonema minus]
MRSAVQLACTLVACLSLCSAFVSMSSGPSSRRQVIQTGVAAAGAALLPSVVSAAAPAKAKVYETDNGILYVVRKEGSGPRPRDGDLVAIKYIGYLNNGKAFDINDGSVAGRKPTVFKLGAKQVIPAWEEIVRYMNPGAEYNIVVPAKLGYGDKGVCVGDGECLVPPNETLKFTIILDKVAISP